MKLDIIPDEDVIKSDSNITILNMARDQYIFWNRSEAVLYYIYQFLKKNFPGSIVIKEFNYIDFVVIDKNLPVEVQSTIINGKGLSHLFFERMIEKQIKENVDRYGYCRFFFDSEYLRYLQNDITRASRVCLDWLYQLIKEEKIKVFTVSHNGIIKETSYKDFDFLSKISIACRVSIEEDFRILDRNRFKIASSILKGYGFDSDEIYGFRDCYEKDGDRHFIYWLKRKEHSDRERLLGSILEISK